MAPSRRRGANKAKNKAQLSLGDLVLAKVKGHPFWPAKISKPEDWQKVPDPKKYFVQFFGTEEIAFVAPVDIQAFTSDSKSKISARCQGKSKYFSQAVKEICEAFDELQKKNSNDLRVDTDRSDHGCDALSVDGVEDNGVNVEIKDDKGVVGSDGETVKEECAGDFGSKLERCSQLRGENDTEDVDPSTSCGAKESSSPVFSSEEKNKMSSVVHPKVPKTSNSSHLKTEVSDLKHEDGSLPNATIMIHQPSGGYSGQAKDMTIHTKQIVRVWDSLNALYSKHTGQSKEIIEKNMDRDYFMTPEEAKKFGIIDEVIDERPMALVTDAVGKEGKESKEKDKSSN